MPGLGAQPGHGYGEDDAPPPVRQRSSAKRYPRTAKILFQVWFTVFTLITAITIPVELVELFNPASYGPAGTVVVTSCHGRRDETCVGNFTSDDGLISFTGADVSGVGPNDLGRSLAAYGDQEGRSVLVPSGEHVEEITISAALLIGWLAQVYYGICRPARRRRRQTGLRFE